MKISQAFSQPVQVFPELAIMLVDAPVPYSCEVSGKSGTLGTDERVKRASQYHNIGVLYVGPAAVKQRQLLQGSTVSNKLVCLFQAFLPR